MVFGVAVRLLGNRHDAEDICQEVFLKAYRRFDSIRTNPARAGWLKAVTRNLCLDHLRRYRARWSFFSDMAAPELTETLEGCPAFGEEVDTRMDTVERHARVRQALERLPESQRAPLLLFHFEEMGYAQIATRLGMMMNTVKNNIFRGRKRLRRSLQN
jgi:RNA polymerase sigma-70 factor, ECF subfamily